MRYKQQTTETAECRHCFGIGVIDSSGPGHPWLPDSRVIDGFRVTPCHACAGSGLSACPSCGSSQAEYGPFKVVDGMCEACVAERRVAS